MFDILCKYVADHPDKLDLGSTYHEANHPGLVHLVSTVAGRLRPGVGWAGILDATFPPGSVSGAPKSSALTTIQDLESVPRGPYCGAVGWVDADRDEAELAVGIRTFWAERDVHGTRVLRFGTGAGITWGSDPVAEWAETQLKASRLVGLTASSRDGRTTGPAPTPSAGSPPPRLPVGAAPRRPR